MSAKSKSIFVLVGILVLGLVLGVMLQTTIHNKQMERTRSLRDRGALSEMIADVVKPESDAQSQAVKEVVTRWEESLDEMMHDAFRMRSALFDSMHQELAQDVLTPEQVDALDEWRTKNRRGSRRGNSGRRDSSNHP